MSSDKIKWYAEDIEAVKSQLGGKRRRIVDRAGSSQAQGIRPK